MTDGDAGTDGVGNPDAGTAPAREAAEPDDASPLDGLVDRPAASAGTVVAAVALAAAFLPWTDAPPLVPSVVGASSTLAAAFAGLATVAFLLARYGALDRRAGAAVAGIASAAVVVVGLARFVGPEMAGGEPPSLGAGLLLAMAAGLLAFGLAIAEYHDVTAAGLVERARRPAVGFALLFTAFVLASFLSVPFQSLELGLIGARVMNTVVLDAALVAITLAFLLASGRGLAFVDLSRPGIRDLAYVGAGFVALLAGQVLVAVLVTVLGLPSTGNQVVSGAEQTPELLLVLIPLQFLAVGPAEELFNRNLLQKYFYGAFSRPTAIVVASGVFASAHLFSYSGESAAGTLVSIVAVLVLGAILGVVYERTGNVVVPILAHGLYNATLFGLLYVAIVFSDVDPQSMAVLPW